MDDVFLVVAGIPGAGKSTFSRWLAAEHGFVHRDVDTQGVPSGEILANRPIVIDWGFPAHETALSSCIHLIEEWKQSGARLWWFDADRDMALRSFMRRGTVSKDAWDYQLLGINKNWAKIEAVTDHRIDVLNADGVDLSAEELYEIILSE